MVDDKRERIKFTKIQPEDNGFEFPIDQPEEFDWLGIYNQEQERKQEAANNDSSLETLLTKFIAVDAEYKRCKGKTDTIEQERRILEDKLIAYFEENGKLTAVEGCGKKFRQSDLKFASPDSETKDEMFRWLREEGYGGKIKQAQESIHPKTLATIITEVEGQGIEVPKHNMKIIRKIRIS